ncbi:MAG: peroxiredoxin [Acidobacteriota bacterium]
MTAPFEAGQPFPALQLPDEHENVRSLDDLAGNNGLILFVYPKDNTPGCTVEAKDFRDRLGDFHALGYTVAGLSKDGAKSHCRFIDKHELTFPLLTDKSGDYLESIGAFGEKKLYGKTSLGIIRSTYVIGADGAVQHVFRNVRAKGHAERVLKKLS